MQFGVEDLDVLNDSGDGDFNSKLPRDTAEITGPFCLHYYTDSGGRQLMELAANTNLVCSSTMRSNKHLLGQALNSRKVNKKCSQIDYIFVSKRFQSNIGSM